MCVAFGSVWPQGCERHIQQHPSSIERDMTLGSLAIRLWRRLPQRARLVFWRMLCWIGRRLYGTKDLRSQRLPFGLWCKFPSEGAREAATMRFISSRTSIPMPTVVDFVPGNELTGGGEDYLILTTISGTHPRLSEYNKSQRESLGKQIRAFVDQLRAIPAPGPEICTFGGGSYNNLRLGWNPTGPFADLDAFNAHLLSLVPPRVRENPTVAAAMVKRHRIVFSHNDLLPRNILVDPKGQLVGILDWEMAGWFPEYWEYTAALGLSVSQPWIEMLKGMFVEYELERQAESILSTNVTHI